MTCPNCGSDMMDTRDDCLRCDRDEEFDGYDEEEVFAPADCKYCSNEGFIDDPETGLPVPCGCWYGQQTEQWQREQDKMRDEEEAHRRWLFTQGIII